MPCIHLLNSRGGTQSLDFVITTYSYPLLLHLHISQLHILWLRGCTSRVLQRTSRVHCYRGVQFIAKITKNWFGKQPLVGKFEFREYGKIIQELLNLLVFGQCKKVSNIHMVWQCLAYCLIFGSNYQMLCSKNVFCTQ